jgi:6-phosphogluconolactonase
VAIITVLKDEETLAAAAAERVTSRIEASLAVGQAAHVCLTGGQTPRRLYELLADASRAWRSRIDWARVHVFWTDERHVPPDHAESNSGMAYRALLSHVSVPPTQIHRMRGELADAADAAREYEIVLNGFRGPQPFDALRVAPSNVEGQGSAPPALFDVMVLGLGEDAHIASIFPGSPLLDAGAGRLRQVGSPSDPTGQCWLGGPLSRTAPASRLEGSLAAAVWVEHLNAWRITLTPPALLDARAMVMVVSGGKKAAAVRAALDQPEDVTRWPAHILRAAGDRIEWFIDSAAARMRGAPPS